MIEDLRRKAIGSLALSDLRLEKELPGWTSDMAGFAMDDSFSRYALRDVQGTVSVRRVSDGQEILQLRASKKGEGLEALGFSPDGRYLATDEPQNRFKVWDLDHKKSAVTLAEPIGNTWCFSPDSRRLVVVFANSTLGVYDIATGTLERRWKLSNPGCRDSEFHPDGQQFVAIFREFIQFWSVDSGRLLATLISGTGTGYGGWGAQGQLLTTTNEGDPLIHIWDVHNKRPFGVLEGHKNRGILASSSPASDLVASNGWESMLRLWQSRTGRQLLSMNVEGYPRFNRRGDRILLRAKTPQIWEVAEGREYRTFVSDPAAEKRSPTPVLAVPTDGFSRRALRTAL